jgi:hypothetical protein
MGRSERHRKREAVGDWLVVSTPVWAAISESREVNYRRFSSLVKLDQPDSLRHEN